MWKILIFHLIVSLGLLFGVGLVAVGASGVLAAGLGAAFGTAFVSGDPPGRTYSPQRCDDFLRFHPESRDCASAATAHHFDEVVQYRVTAGVLGALVVGAVLLVRRGFRDILRERVLPDTFSATVGSSLFGLATVGTLGGSLLRIAFGQPSGAGSFLSGGIVSLVMFAWYARSFVLALRPGPRQGREGDKGAGAFKVRARAGQQQGGEDRRSDVA